MKDLKSVLLLLLSVSLIGTWLFHFYEKEQYANRNSKTLIKNTPKTSSVILEKTNDSSQKKNQQVKDTISVYLDSLKSELLAQTNEVSSLRKQMEEFIKTNSPNNKLNVHSNSVNPSPGKRSAKLRSENKIADSQKKSSPEFTKFSSRENTKITLSDSSFIVSNASLQALNTQEDEKGITVSAADLADKFIFSFTLHNYRLKNSYYDVYIVITGPGDKVLDADAWGGENYFFSKNEGETKYTRRIRFEYEQGAMKKIESSIEPSKISPGIYTLKIYQNGFLIGKTIKVLG